MPLIFIGAHKRAIKPFFVHYVLLMDSKIIINFNFRRVFFMSPHKKYFG